MDRYYWINRGCTSHQFILCMVFIVFMSSILVVILPLSKMVGTDKTFTMRAALTMFKNSFQQYNFRKMSDPIIIFTCLGAACFTKHQTYIWQSINQTRMINPTIQIVVISSRLALQSNITKKLMDLNITVVINDDMILNNSIAQDFHRAFFVQGVMEPDGNKEFVQFTLERLVSIYIYMKKYDQAHVFHIENDNMLYVDLRKLGARMRECEVNLAVPKAAKDQAVVSFMYINNVQPLEQFIKWCIDVFRLGRDNATKLLKTSYINDMTLTAHYLKLQGATIQHSERSGVYELPTQFIEKFDECCLCSLEGGPLIFDACVLGQYFGGTYWTPNRPHWESNRLVDPRGDILSWKLVGDNIRVPYIRNRRITNIHVHSKRLEQFSSLGNHQITGDTKAKT